MGTTTIHISLPDALKRYVDEQADATGCGSPADYLRDLIRQDQQLRTSRKPAALVTEGLDSGSAICIDAGYFARKRDLLKSAG